ncbi:22954_t:CDS:1, partial [Gigaspora rosea]
MATRRVLGESNIPNLPEQGQAVVQKNKSTSVKKTERKIKKSKRNDEHEFTELEQKEFDENPQDIFISIGDILNETECTNILEKIPDKHITEKKTLSELYKSQFSQWYLELRSGFNILFYGYGSKKELLGEFSEVYLRDQPLIVINGFYPKLDIGETFMQIINGINLEVDMKPGTRASMEKLTTLIRDYFLNPDRDFQHLYITVHNIDGQNLRTLQVQNCLGILASCPNIHLIASVDHINATLLFDQDRTA